ncbi:Fpg/Nei family DNA glycosylase [Natronosporangium hydrolyticum]|uniref:Fpg/Nei family DNA glycosylase n=1 Tax=Natronosporangium hydrolyticum TaxID=2811111 RepID=A0A895YHT0_9ACTN|nr:DNA-formamidopyrimidine glycosylase family protein [Natronosporangium hydrolyticum]QSB15079.1 Fpg/Nei family DNA glycosylase [Natronosporangium hydrolyticum]
MPELPDVEGYRRTLAEHGTGHRIQQVEVLDPGVLRDTDPAELASTLAGQQLRRPDRHGKWLLAHTDGPTVLLHFGMTGELRWMRSDEPRHRHDRVVFRLDDGAAELRYRDMRKLQGLRLAHGPGEVEQELAELGPDALGIERDEFLTMLQQRRGAIKPALVDQSRIAGLGNLLADEILWRARVHPTTPARQLTDAQRRRLYDQLRRVLARAVPAGRVPPLPSWLTGVRDQQHPHCPRCGAELSRTTVGGRSTVWCPHCQASD